MKNSQNQNGFTLTELLVVVIVLVVFATIFGVSIPVAREKAMQAQCAHNMQRLVEGWIAYTHDHNGNMVPYSEKRYDTGKSWIDVAQWPTLMPEYLADPALTKVQPKTPTTVLTPDGPLSCPSAGKGMRINTSSMHYGINIALKRTKGGWDRLSEIPFPAKTIVFVDTDNRYLAGPTPWAQKYIAFRHDNGANCAFADGHVEWMSRAELTVEQDEDWHGKAPWQPR